MGCSISKLLSRPRRNSGEIGNKLVVPEPPPPVPPDPRLPLSARQKFSMVKSWKGINRAMEPTGVNMFLRLFEDHGDLIHMFSKFRELRTRSQQAESLELAEHANVVMTSIDEGIRAMDNVDFFFDLLHEIGASHRRIPGFKKEYFWKIEQPFLEAVKLTLDERYTENIENIYKITIKFVIETVIIGYDAAGPAEGEGSKLTEISNTASDSPINDAIHNIKSTANATFMANKADAKIGAAACPFPLQNSVQNQTKQAAKLNNNINNS